MSITARAAELDVSPRTLQAQIAQGIGPEVTHVGLKTKRIEDEPWERWRRERRENPPAEVLGVSPNPLCRERRENPPAEVMSPSPNPLCRPAQHLEEASP
jgi:hypothetical protein